MNFKGLYQKALAIRSQDELDKKPGTTQSAPDLPEPAAVKKKLTKTKPGTWDKTSPAAMGQTISPDQTNNLGNGNNEEEEELKKINSLLDSKRLDIKPETFRFKAQKNGSVLPFIINLAAFLLIIAGSAILIVMYNKSERSITSDLKNYRSNESNLLTAVKEELDQKEAQISSIQQQMQNIQKEKDQLKKDMAARLDAREQELAQALKKELEAEKQKLLGQGLDTQVIAERLQSAEKQKEAEKAKQLASYQTELNQELTKKEADYSQTITDFQQQLVAAQQNRAQLTAELQKSKTDQQKLAEQGEALRLEQSRMAGELAKIQELQQKESFIIDQINADYSQVNTQVKAGQYQAALQSLTGLEDLLNTRAVMALPAVQQRRATDLIIVQTLKKYLTEASQPNDSQSNDRQAQATSARTTAKPADQTTDRQAEKERLTLKIKEGEKFFEKKDYQKAFSSYVATLDTLNLDSEYLTQLKNRFLNAGKALYTVEQQARASRESTLLINQALNREMTRKTLLDKLAQFKRDYEQLIQKKPKASRSNEAEMLTLIDAKLLVKQIISSEPVRTQYPDLYELLERYFKALSDEQKLEGERLVLADLVNFMENLDNTNKLTTIRKNWSVVYSRPTNELLLQLIDRIQAVIQK